MILSSRLQHGSERLGVSGFRQAAEHQHGLKHEMFTEERDENTNERFTCRRRILLLSV